MSWRQYRYGYCTVDGKEISLSGLEAEIVLRLLLAFPGHYVSLGDLLEFIYPNPDAEPDWANNCIQVMLTRLRKKGIQIENMHRTGSGYGGWRLKNRKLTRVVSMNWPEFQRQVCVINDEEVSLTPQETELLLILLLKHPKRHTPVSELIEAMWPNPDLEPDWAAKRLQVLVFNLRGKGVEIESRYQFGYRIPVHARGDTPQQLELAA